MTKAEFIAKVAAKTMLSKAQAEKAVNGSVDVLKETLKKGDRLSLIGFGTFSVVKRKARSGRNPRTGAKITIAARKAAKFSASSVLSGELNGKKAVAKKAPAKAAKKSKKR